MEGEPEIQGQSWGGGRSLHVCRWQRAQMYVHGSPVTEPTREFYVKLLLPQSSLLLQLPHLLGSFPQTSVPFSFSQLYPLSSLSFILLGQSEVEEEQKAENVSFSPFHK